MNGNLSQQPDLTEVRVIPVDDKKLKKTSTCLISTFPFILNIAVITPAGQILVTTYRFELKFSLETHERCIVSNSLQGGITSHYNDLNFFRVWFELEGWKKLSLPGSLWSMLVLLCGASHNQYSNPYFSQHFFIHKQRSVSLQNKLLILH